MESYDNLMSQLIFKFPFKTEYFKQDFYVSANNFSAYKLIESWPNWPSKWLNVFGASGSGKTHLTKILEKKIVNVKIFDAKDVDNTAIPILENIECIIIDNFKNNILLIMAFQKDKMVASAINFISKTHLYGRLWGSKYEVPFLHFELCYYQAIEYAIRNNIKIVEAGAQGEHKLQRGYVPTKTWSAHWIKDQEFSKAIQNFLDNESQLIDNQKERLDDFLPFKN